MKILNKLELKFKGKTFQRGKIDGNVAMDNTIDSIKMISRLLRGFQETRIKFRVLIFLEMNFE
jgi:hypothetical protein